MCENSNASSPRISRVYLRSLSSLEKRVKQKNKMIIIMIIMKIMAMHGTRYLYAIVFFGVAFVCVGCKIFLPVLLSPLSELTSFAPDFGRRESAQQSKRRIMFFE